ncbi:MAG TPA: YfcE family phosphodiesterase [Bacteroidales bacterium]|nr:YfcE family phosphodiesterase [Bacteroidales bacterium]
MKKIGVMSDTHGHLPKEVYEFFKDVDLVIHAGDIGSVEVLDELKAFKETVAVYGNIDDFDVVVRTEKIENIEVEGLKIMVTHIGGYPNKYERGIKELIEAQRPNIFISGHSHILKVMNDPKYSLLHINPGAAGRQGIHQISTLIRFTIDSVPKDLEVLEFNK